jgi:hypothetical protein
MVVPMPDGSTAVIDHLPITEAKETLGVYSCLNGNSDGALKAMKEKAAEWVDKAKEGHLRRSDVWFLLDCQFWPRVGYGLCCNLATQLKLEDCLSKQYYDLLPLGGVIIGLLLGRFGSWERAFMGLAAQTQGLNAS